MQTAAAREYNCGFSSSMAELPICQRLCTPSNSLIWEAAICVAKKPLISFTQLKSVKIRLATNRDCSDPMTESSHVIASHSG